MTEEQKEPTLDVHLGEGSNLKTVIEWLRNSRD